MRTRFDEERKYAFWLRFDQKNFTGIYKCPDCGKEYTFKEVTGKEKSKVGHNCPHCGVKLY